MTAKKTANIETLLDSIKVDQPLPSRPLKEATLMEQGMLCIIRRTKSNSAAEAAYGRLKKHYEDWNEARVAHIQEMAMVMGGKSLDKPAPAAVKSSLQTGRDIKTYLQEVYQRTHSLDLSEISADLSGAIRIVQEMPFTGLVIGNYLISLASNGDLPIHSHLVRVLDRLGVVPRTPSIRKARASIHALVKEGKGLEFGSAFAHVAEHWCDSRKPVCHECAVVDYCKHGKKVFADWKINQVKLEALRKREEKRQVERDKKEAARLAREEVKKQRELEKKAATDKKRKDADNARKRKALEAQRKASTKKKAAAAKIAAAKKAATAKKAGTKKPAAKKATSKKTTAKKASTKKASPPAARKKATTATKKTVKKATTKKATPKKAATKKPAPKPAAKKVTKKKAVAKKVTKKVTKKPAPKKPAAKKPAAKKPAAKKGGGR